MNKETEELLAEQRNLAYDIAEEQERARERLQHDAYVKDVLRKLLDFAVEGLENPEQAEKKVQVIMQSAVFANNERDFFPDIQANSFLADCYYTLRLGANPSVEHVSKLSVPARNFLVKWADAQRNDMYASQVKKAYTIFRSQKEEQERKEAERRAIQQSIWDEENAQREAERHKKYLAEKALHNSKKRRQELVAIVGSSICSLLFLGGFIAGGFIMPPIYISKSYYLEIGIFYILLLICLYPVFLLSKEYILEISDKLFLWLLWTGMILLFIGTCLLWKESTGFVRIILIAATIGLPLIPYIRGIIGSVALGFVAGFVSFHVFSFVIGGTIRLIFK